MPFSREGVPGDQDRFRGLLRESLLLHQGRHMDTISKKPGSYQLDELWSDQELPLDVPAKGNNYHNASKSLVVRRLCLLQNEEIYYSPRCVICNKKFTSKAAVVISHNLGHYTLENRGERPHEKWQPGNLFWIQHNALFSLIHQECNGHMANASADDIWFHWKGLKLDAKKETECTFEAQERLFGRFQNSKLPPISPTFWNKSPATPTNLTNPKKATYRVSITSQMWKERSKAYSKLFKCKPYEVLWGGNPGSFLKFNPPPPNNKFKDESNIEVVR